MAKATKAMNAKKIAKDMERWAKAKNRQQAKANPLPKAEPEQPMEEPSTVVRNLKSIGFLLPVLMTSPR